MQKRGLFICIEGADGCGKSTHAKLLFDAMQNCNLPCAQSREPGGSKEGEFLRGATLGGKYNFAPVSEFLLFNAARAENIKSSIMPALNAGQVVIVDRYVLSTMVYQGLIKNLGIDLVHKVHELLQFPIPDITFLLSVGDTSKRLQERSEGLDDNQYSENIAHLLGNKSISEYYFDVYYKKKDELNIHAIDSSQDIGVTHSKIVTLLNEKFNLGLRPYA